jgi:BirA family transcriptional regulator, biotin operon repressor / biotin---[acetyl-CoA-carboxylase] ligase
VNALCFKNIKRFRSLDSTFSYAQKWLRDSRPQEGSVILADFQTSGKGTGANKWESESGQNILLSMILYPHFLNVKNQFYLNKIFSLVILKTISHFTDSNNIAVKWPNDVMIDKKKIAGLLFQNNIVADRITSTVLGVGINVNQEIFPEHIPYPCSLKSVTGKNFDRDIVLDYFFQITEYYYQLLYGGAYDKINQEYLSNLLNFGVLATYFAEEKEFSGIITGISEFGHLEIMVNGKTKLFDMKEISFHLK